MTSVEGGRWIPPAPRPTRRRFRRATTDTGPDTTTENRMDSHTTLTSTNPDPGRST